MTPQTNNMITYLGDRPEHLANQLGTAADDSNLEVHALNADEPIDADDHAMERQGAELGELVGGAVETLTGPGPSRAALLEASTVGSKRKR